MPWSEAKYEQVIRSWRGFRHRLRANARFAKRHGHQIHCLYTRMAEELQARIEHLEKRLPPPLPPAPWFELFMADADLEFKFQVAQWNKAQQR